MPFKDPEKKKHWQKEYSHRYWLLHKNNPLWRDKKRQLCKAWEQRNKERRQRYQRENRVGREGITFYVKKRPWTGFCEICGKKVEKNLMYHEFNDQSNGIGIWVCGRCHRYCHGYDHLEYLEKYLQLKNEIGAQTRPRLEPQAEWVTSLLKQAGAENIPVFIKKNYSQFNLGEYPESWKKVEER